MQLTYKYRLKDKHASELNRMAKAVSFVFNYCNETQKKAAKERRRWLTGFDLQKLTAGTSKELGLHSHTIQQVCKQYETSRKTHKKPWLRWRGKKSLGWVPFNSGHVTVAGQAFKFRGRTYQPMHWRELPPGAKLGAGSFNQDSRGRWYINLPVEVPEASKHNGPAVGIDLGLKELATLSDGTKVENPRWYRKLEETLGKAQRANKRRRVKAIHAKIKNVRKDFLHKESNRITNTYGTVAVGNVSSKKLAKTKLAKSVLDAGWSVLRQMLAYKSLRNGAVYLEVDERFSTQLCSSCGELPPERPKGIAGLGIREWVCSVCGTVHDRDVNAAQNILRVGMHTLAGGAHA